MILKFEQTLTPIVGDTIITTDNFESLCSKLVKHYNDQIVLYANRIGLIDLDMEEPILGYPVFIRFDIGKKEVTSNGDIIYPITLSSFDVGYDYDLYMALAHHYSDKIKFERFINVCIGHYEMGACAVRPLLPILKAKFKYSEN